MFLRCLPLAGADLTRTFKAGTGHLPLAEIPSSQVSHGSGGDEETKRGPADPIRLELARACHVGPPLVNSPSCLPGKLGSANPFGRLDPRPSTCTFQHVRGTAVLKSHRSWCVRPRLNRAEELGNRNLSS